MVLADSVLHMQTTTTPLVLVCGLRIMCKRLILLWVKVTVSCPAVAGS